MSLVRLLAAGRSLIGATTLVGQYRMRSKNGLPKFGSPKNPFFRAPQTPAPPSDIPAAGAVPRPPAALTPAEVDAANLKETRRLPVMASSVQAGTRAVPAAPGRWDGIRRLVRALHPFAKRPIPRTEAQPTARRASRPPVQCELSLENIQVMRNDLSDADVELVQSKPAAKAKPESVRRAGVGSALMETKSS
jgi:hypothetical protein